MEDDAILRRRGRAPDAVVAYGAHPDQVVELRGDPSAPLVVVIHGGFWRRGLDRAHAGAQSDALADAGLRVATVEYRRIPGNPDVTVADVRAAVDAVGPGILVGHSAGGHLALLLAATGAPARGVVALGPVASLRAADGMRIGDDAVRDLLGTTASVRPDLDPAELPPAPIPVVLIHGDADETVPIAVSADYLAANPAELVELRGSGHLALIDPVSPEFATVVAIVRRLAASEG